MNRPVYVIEFEVQKSDLKPDMVLTLICTNNVGPAVNIYDVCHILSY